MASTNDETSSSLHAHDDLDCVRAMQQLWDFLDHELNDEQMKAVRHHLDCCSDCFSHKAWGERFLDAIHALRDERLMPPELKARVVEKLKSAGYTR
jgi:anti-sigma factor (TIGR02949 family)